MIKIDKIQEFYFFGSNYKIAQILDHSGNLKEIFCTKNAFNKNIYNYAKLYSIKFNLIKNRKDLNSILTEKPNNSVGISYGFNIIFKQENIDKFTFGIWNIHSGELPQNRGRHPVSWSFLRGCKKFGLTIHEINEEIDRGHLLAEIYIKRDLNDTEDEITEKMIREIEKGLLKKAIDNYFSGNKVKLEKGVYYENLINKFVSINTKDYDGKFLFNLFKSQAKYGGVEVENKKYKECVFYNEEYSDLYKEYDIYICKYGEKVALK